MAKRRFVIRVLAVVAVACILVLLGIRFVAVPAFENSPDHVHIVVTSVDPLPSGTTTGMTPGQLVLTLPASALPGLVERLEVTVAANAALAPFHQGQKEKFNGGSGASL